MHITHMYHEGEPRTLFINVGRELVVNVGRELVVNVGRELLVNVGRERLGNSRPCFVSWMEDSL